MFNWLFIVRLFGQHYEVSRPILGQVPSLSHSLRTSHVEVRQEINIYFPEQRDIMPGEFGLYRMYAVQSWECASGRTLPPNPHVYLYCTPCISMEWTCLVFNKAYCDIHCKDKPQSRLSYKISHIFHKKICLLLIIIIIIIIINIVIIIVLNIVISINSALHNFCQRFTYNKYTKRNLIVCTVHLI